MDLAVIGGGITGAGVLRWAGSRGLDAVLFERDQLASGATGRNAGFLLAGVAANYADAVAVYGRAAAREVWAFTLENHRRLAEVLDGAGAGYRRAGSWVLAADAEEATQLQAAETLMREDGFEAAWHPAPDLRGAAFGALLSPADGEVDSAAVVRLLAAAGEVRVGVRIRGIEPAPGGVRLLTNAGDIEATAAVIATNAHARDLWPAAPIEPVRGQMLLTAPVPGMVADRPVYSDRGYRYWRQLPDQRLALGGWRNTAFAEEVGFDDQPTPRIQDRLDAHLRALGVDVPVERRWAGTMGFTPDRLPLVGAVPGRPGVFVCAGYSGHGMGFAYEAARLLVDHVLEGAPVPGWMAPSRPHQLAAKTGSAT